MPVEDDAEIRTILHKAKTIAVVGASPKPERDSNRIAEVLIHRGYTVYPVNPAYTECHGVRCYPDLASVPSPIDIVDVFRKPEAVEEIADQAIAAHAGTLWLQSGIVNHRAAEKAEKAGLHVVMDRCIAVELRRLL